MLEQQSSREELESGSEAKGPKLKQAVLVIHGMGEQRPMETLRSFVESVWIQVPELVQLGLAAGSASEYEKRVSELGSESSSHGKASGKPGEGAGPALNKTWIVPDARTGSSELARITTPVGQTNVRTDFYELYWADVMQGTTWQHLWAWVRGLLFRWEVPRDVLVAWVVLWIATLFAAALFLLTAFPGEFGPDGVFEWISAHRTSVAIGLTGVAAFLLLASVGLGRDILWPAIAGLLVLALLIRVLPAWVFDNERLMTGALAVLLVAGIHNLVVPTFGDVARYVQARPSTIEKRAAVRERGLALMRCLHDSAEYDRVVVVGHSLGSIIAYDLLQLAWSEYGPTVHNKPSSAVLDAVRATNATLKALHPKAEEPALPKYGAWSDKEIDKWRALQSSVARQLIAENRLSKANPIASEGPPQGTRKACWKVTDFVTLGCPLTHAEFLIGKNLSEFKELVRRRQVSLSPPLPDEEFTSAIHGDGTQKEIAVHHAAMFVATRWTNIHHPHRAIFWGDIISGSLVALFGPGIREYQVDIVRPRALPLLRRFFTHTEYWQWQQSYRGDVPEHIRLLRQALDLEWKDRPTI